MAENRGIAPPDVTTPVGEFRAMIGDVEYEEYDPPQPGYGMYKKFSDVEIQGFLKSSDNSMYGALYFAYMQIAASAASESRTVADYDLKYDSTKRPGEFRALAQMWKDKWDGEQADVFEVFDTVGQPTCYPELAAWPVGVCRGNRLF